MIIYSTMPPELVFANMDQIEKQQVKEIDMGGGVTMMVEPVSSSEGRVIRLISPNPQDYLNPRFAPGQTISFRPEIT